MSIGSIKKKNNVHVSGQGRRTMVFGHGFGTDQRAWRLVGPAFAADYDLVSFDHVGFGGSDAGAYADSRHSSLDGYALDVLDLLDALNLEQVTYVGHSVGGVIGLLASIQQPQRFTQLVLLGSSPRFVNDPPDYTGGFERHEIEGILDAMERDQLAWADSLAPMAMGAQSSADLVQDFGNGLRALDPLIARQFGRATFLVDCRDQLPRVSVPSLIVQCTQDSIVPRVVGQYLHEHLAGSTLREIDGAGHCPHLSHPKQTIGLIADYLGVTVA